MKKLIVIFILLIAVDATASCVGINLSSMLEWKYGPVAGTRDNQLTYFNYSGLTTLSPEQLASDCNNYILPNAKAVKIAEIKAEGLSRLQVYLPGVKDWDTFHLIKELWLSITPAARQPTAAFQSAIDIYQAGLDAIADINALATSAEIAAYNTTWP